MNIYLYSILLAYTSLIFNLTLIDVSFYSPSFLAPLVVFPLYFIGKELNREREFILASFILLFSTVFFSRTVSGFSDTDSLLLFFIFSIFLSFLYIIKNKKYSLLFFSLIILLSHWWYYQIEILIFSMLILSFFYLFLKKEINTTYLILIFGLIPLLSIPIYFKVGIIIFLYFFKEYIFKFNFLKYFFSLVILCLFLYGFQELFVNKVSYYFMKTGNISGVGFQKMSMIITESKGLTLDTFMNYFFNSKIMFFLGFLGFLYSIYKEKILFLFLPFFVLGLSSLFSGVRFFIYIEPFFSLGLSFLFIALFDYSNHYFKKIYILFFLAFCLYCFQKDYKVWLFFPKIETFKSFYSLKKYDTNNSLILSSWHNGYPLMYFTNSIPFTNGSLHGGQLNYLTAYAFFSDEKKSYNFIINYGNTINNNFEKYIENKDNSFKDKKEPRNFIEKINDREELHRYLTINSSNHVDFNKSILIYIDKEISPKTFIKEFSFIDENKSIDFFNEKIIEKNKTEHITFNEKTLSVTFFKKTKSIKNIFKDGKVIKISNDGKLSLYVTSDNLFLIDSNYDSCLYIKLITGTYDKSLFSSLHSDDNFSLFKINK